MVGIEMERMKNKPRMKKHDGGKGGRTKVGEEGKASRECVVCLAAVASFSTWIGGILVLSASRIGTARRTVWDAKPDKRRLTTWIQVQGSMTTDGLPRRRAKGASKA